MTTGLQNTYNLRMIAGAAQWRSKTSCTSQAPAHRYFCEPKKRMTTAEVDSVNFCSAQYCLHSRQRHGRMLFSEAAPLQCACLSIPTYAPAVHPAKKQKFVVTRAGPFFIPLINDINADWAKVMGPRLIARAC